jgi:hypothetical protein
MACGHFIVAETALNVWSQLSNSGKMNAGRTRYGVNVQQIVGATTALPFPDSQRAGPHT